MKSESAFNGVMKYTTTGRRKTKAELQDAYYAQFRYKCPHCGTNVYIGKEDKRLCRTCHNYVWKDKKVEFKERLENARKNYR